VNLLALAQGVPVGGSVTSLRRVSAHLRDCGHTVTTKMPEDVLGDGGLERAVADHSADAVFGMHAYWTGRLCLDSPVPYVIVLSGTDLNEFVHVPEQLAVMTEAVEGAAALVTYDEGFREKAVALWPEVGARLNVITKGVSTSASGFSLRAALGLDREARVFLLPAVLHPTKDVLFLAAEIERWHERDDRIHLVVVGLPSDLDYVDAVDARSAGGWLHRLDPLPQPDLHAAMLEAAAVLNTSTSECCPNSVLEAMDLGCALAVREIPGNLALVEHGETGLVAATATEMREQLERLIEEPALRDRLGDRAREHARAHHGLAAERDGYGTLFASLEAGGAGTRPQLGAGL
jgi:glycosyltransferase involved in cell wall biosynthesis